MQRPASVLTCVLGLILIATGAGCTKGQKNEIYAEATIDSAGGEYRLGGVIVKAPAGAVARSTKLIVTKPQPVADSAQAPLRTRGAAGVSFDVGLDGGQQPLKALTLSFPLSGDFLPAGAKAENALAYGAASTAGGFQLVPSQIETAASNAQLVVSLNHLSPKWIVFPDLAKIASEIFSALVPSGLYRARPADCHREATFNGTEVQLAVPTNWSDGNLSPVHPCVEIDGNQLRLKIVNNSLVYYQMAVAEGVAPPQFEHSDINADMVKLIASKLFPNKIVQGFLGRSESAYIATPPGLTTYVELRTTPDTFLAEASWIAMNFGVEMFFGDKSKAKQVFENIEIISCLQSLVKTPSSSNIADWMTGFIETALSKCGENLARQIIPKAEWNTLLDFFWGKLVATFNLVKTGVVNVLSAFDGIARQIPGTIVVVLQPKTTCPSAQQFIAAAGPQLFEKAGLGRQNFRSMSLLSPVTCEAGWAAATGTVIGQDGGASARYLLQYRSGAWALVAAITTAGMYSSYTEPGFRCSSLPPKVFKAIDNACTSSQGE